ncbi:outer membrane beta-barrel protein [Pseudoxanthomonas dokdonensis]|uniref:Outer membrane protein beta-barrel domain-containing protein n=1 Tax=Pseudoxanthomonas dokdonensis TaxID=344882 RepID=A0A0R0D0S4_9GAMM|nr:outer membrane beta-barrel protein [Pseudoxanthomonas dokdonensis]KRG71975.1 hypothetical protein ABB29_00460 [Pseudoxanthomonas dokdonensis]
MKKSLLLASLLLTAPFAASAAEGISYSYVEGGYQAFDIDEPGDGNGNDADGWALRGSYALTDNLHVFGGYSQMDVDSLGDGLLYNTDAQLDGARVGLGVNFELSSRLDMVARGAYEWNKLEHDKTKLANGDVVGLPTSYLRGYSFEMGVNAALVKNRLNASAFMGYQDGTSEISGSNYRNENNGIGYGRVGLEGVFNPNWSIVADAKIYDGSDIEWFVGPRFTF